MSIAPLPTPLQHLGGRRFSFSPPIRNIRHNEWLYRYATWSECVVASTSTGEEILIPRMFVGDVRETEGALLLVRLSRELEWKDGAVIPRQRGVIEMPLAAVEPRPSVAPRDHPAPVISIRLESRPEVRKGKWIGATLVLGVVALTAIADVARQSWIHPRSDSARGGNKRYLRLTEADDYSSVLRKLGVPSTERTVDLSGGRIMVALNYTARRYTVVLLGTARYSSRYTGTLDPAGRVLHSVRFSGTTSGDLLHSLP